MLRDGVAAVLAVVVAVGLLGHITVIAEEPTATPDPRPSQPPPEAIHCARGGDLKPSLTIPNALTTELNSSTGRIELTVLAVPGGATCYAIHQVGAPSNPSFFEWSVDGVAPKTFELAPPASGQYCFRVQFGDTEGVSDFSSESCVDVAASVAPTPTPTRAAPTNSVTPVAPSSGTGRSDGSSDWLGATGALLIVIAAGGWWAQHQITRSN